MAGRPRPHKQRPQSPTSGPGASPSISPRGAGGALTHHRRRERLAGAERTLRHSPRPGLAPSPSTILSLEFSGAPGRSHPQLTPPSFYGLKEAAV